VLLAVLALLLAAFAARAASSLYLTYRYEKVHAAFLADFAPQSGATRRKIEDLLAPIRGEEFSGDLPLILWRDESVQPRYVFRYFFLHPRLAGCHLYFVFDGPDETSRLIGYRDACE
jgi:hypothetical protein